MGLKMNYDSLTFQCNFLISSLLGEFSQLLLDLRCKTTLISDFWSVRTSKSPVMKRRIVKDKAGVGVIGSFSCGYLIRKEVCVMTFF